MTIMIATRIFRRCRPSPSTISSCGNIRPVNSASSSSLALARCDCSGSHRRRPFPLVPLSHRHDVDVGVASSSWFSTTASSDDDDNNADGPPPIEVTITNNSDSSTSSSQHDNNEGDDGGDDDGDDDPSSSAGPNLSKSSDQVTEEQILSLQSELRTHHRHAAYSPALDTATQLLEMTTSHFGQLHPATASAYNNVGLMNKLLGKYGDATNAYHEALRIYGEVVGKDHASYAAALSNLGMLERGRVLESEARDGEEDENVEEGEGGDNNNEEGIELDKLRDGNSETDSKMSALERMQLNESAIEYFDEAYRIRLSELGSNHPHTITSRSQLGSAMAAAVIAERKGRMSSLVESELRSLKRAKDVKDQKEMEAYVPEAIAKAASKSASGTRLTKRRWEAAEEHLRGALSTAVDNPRGESVGPLLYVPVGSSNATAGSGEKQGGGLTLPPKKDRSMSKKERQKAEKERKRAKRQANLSALKGTSSGGANEEGSQVAIQGTAGKVTTLSAATAAQNLAVFLKNYCDWMRLSLTDESNDSPQQQQQMSKFDKTLQEAHHLYEAALHVRSTVLPGHHPEVVATKFSLAELLDSPRVGSAPAVVDQGDGEKVEVLDGARANALREQILEAYNVEEREGDLDGGSR